ncbi:MAG: isoprenylcysteine carboxylmethyltransferase family protein [Dehalococcoidia bacterium]|nr:isoprenylcysteine carboxylmethyltransferase family protein [Dehalococcoidia bacterium]
MREASSSRLLPLQRLGLAGALPARWLRFGLAIAYFAGLIAWEVWDFYGDDPLALFLSLLTLAYLALIVSCYLRRGPDQPLRRADWLAQIVAVLGANMLAPISMLQSQSYGAETLAVASSIVGLALSFWAVWHLGPAFSIAPEVRRLVRSGPYRWIRHPLYLAGFLIGLGLLASRLSPAAIGLFLGFAGCQALRMGYEEEILAGKLPEYREYRRRTWALLPYLF